MDRAGITKLVKVKLEEFSPFDEPEGLIALPEKDVKPLDSYIDNSLADAFNDVLLTVPLYLIQESLNSISITFTADASQLADGVMVIASSVGYMPVPTDYLRIFSIEFDSWSRAIVNVIDPTNHIYPLQRNKYTRGGSEKPVVVINDNVFEVYTLESEPSSYKFKYVVKQENNCNYFPDNLSELIALRCAISILSIFDQTALVQGLSQEYAAKLQNTALQ